MTDEELKRDRETCEKATPGEWEAPSEHVSDQIGLQIRAVYYPEGDTRRHTTFVCEVHKQAGRPGVGPANAAFIACARTRWPVALDEVERMHEGLREIQNLAGDDEVRPEKACDLIAGWCRNLLAGRRWKDEG